MNNALLNSIYYKKSEKKIQSYDDLVENYVNNLFILYLNLLDEHNIQNLNEAVKVKRKTPDGTTYNTTMPAGWYCVNSIFTAPGYEDKAEDLDKMFLENCHEKDKEKQLESIKNLFMDLACENLDKDEVVDIIKKSDHTPVDDDF
jgi:hypothetical protein